MRSIRILPLLAMVPLLGCDGAGDWLGGPAAATAYAAPLASDTTVVTTRRVWSSSDPDSVFSFDFGMIMPNGTGIAGTDWLTGDPAVFDLVDRESRVFRMNAEPYDTGIALYMLPSPDGSRVAFEWTPNPDSLGSQLRILDVATGESRAIMTPDTAAMNSLIPVAWTPAGDSVFATGWHRNRRDVEVVLVPVAGGTPRRVHAVPLSSFRGDVALSPDGRWLLYATKDFREQQTRSHIYLIDVQGGGARALLELPGLDRLVGWLPGTDIVLFSSDRSGTTDLWSVKVVHGHASTEPRQVRSGFLNSYGLGFGDGALFYSVQTGLRGISVIDVDPQSGAFRGTASPPLPHLSTHPRGLKWSGDGRTLAALTAWGRRADAITIHDMKTGESREFRLNGNVTTRAFEWEPDGMTLLLRVHEAGRPAGPTHFLRMDLVTGTTTRLFPAEEPQEPGPGYLDFRVTPDGRSIVLRRQRVLDDGRTEMKLVLRSLEDGSERDLHRTLDFILEFSISVDGTRLAFMQQVPENSDSLFVMRMDGSGPIRYVASWDYDEVSVLGWLPAGNALLAARLTGPYTSSDAADGPGEEILRIELFDGSVTSLGLSPFRPGRGARHVPGAYRSRLRLSPAGNGLAHSVSESGQELWRMDGLHELFADDPTGRR